MYKMKIKIFWQQSFFTETCRIGTAAYFIAEDMKGNSQRRNLCGHVNLRKVLQRVF